MVLAFLPFSVYNFLISFILHAEEHGMQYLSLKNLCSFLSISTATGRNWLALGKLTPTGFRDNTPFFSEDYACYLRSSLQSGKNAALKQRRNKSYAAGSSLYASYLPASSKNSKAISELCALFEAAAPSEELLSLLLAECSLRLYIHEEENVSADILEDTGGSEPPAFTSHFAGSLLEAFLKDSAPFGEFSSFINDLISDRAVAHQLIKEHTKAFSLPVTYVPQEDTLGFLYLSLRSLRQRKASGAYYTPEQVVKKLIAELDLDSVQTSYSVCSPGTQKASILDPGCGTGSFLLHLPETFPLSSIYGSDTDKLAVALARINLFLRYLPKMSSPALPRAEAVEILRSNITVSDFLLGNDSHTYTHIIGNPPWGSSFSDVKTTLLKKQFSCISHSLPEAYDLFIEQSIRRLLVGGSFAFVLPEAVLTVKAHKAVRRLLLSCCSIQSLTYLGNCFDKVYCPCILLKVQKTDRPHSCIGMRVIKNDGSSFTIEEERRLSEDAFCLSSDDTTYQLLNRLQNTPDCIYLKNNADFALGIVTGDNKSKLVPWDFHQTVSESDTPSAAPAHTSAAQPRIPILRGPDILPYHIKVPSQALAVPLSSCQQAAPESCYFAPEKLVYRFISNRLVFAYDNSRSLLLNSCNLLIPHIPGLSAKYVLAVLNSRVSQFIFHEQFLSVKVLRSHLEQLPIPQASKKGQEEILSLVDQLMEEPYNSNAYFALYEELERKIEALFGLDEAIHQFLSTYRN